MGSDARVDQAMELHQSGKLDEAAQLYEQVIKDNPKDLNGLHLLALVRMQMGDGPAAEQLVRRAIKVDDQQPAFFNTLGLSLRRQDRNEEAKEAFRQTLKLDPKFVQALNNLGLVNQELKQLENAIACFKKAVAIKPDYAIGHFNWGRVEQERGNLSEAAMQFQEAIKIDFDYSDAWSGMAEVLSQLNRPAEAAQAWERACLLRPATPTWHFHRGQALARLKQLSAAESAFRKALELDDRQINAWFALGCSLNDQGKYGQAIPIFEQVLRKSPQMLEAQHNLGQAFFELGLVDQALDSFRRASALAPTEDLPLGAVATVIPGSPRARPRDILRARRAWIRHVRRERSIVPLPLDPMPLDGRKIRLGYVSAFFADRNWMKPVWGLLNRHDREQFEIHLFSDNPRVQVTEGYRPEPRDHFHETAAMNNKELAQYIAAQGIDVLVDLNAYSKLQRLPMYLYRPANRLVAWFNMYATTGSRLFDLLIGDEHVVPPSEEEFYREAVAQVPGSYLSFEVTYRVPAISQAPCQSGNPFTFGSLASLYKITPQTLEAWSDILKEAPESRLLLRNSGLGDPSNRKHLIERFARLGIDERRLILKGPAEHYAFLQTYNEIDLALDPFPYSGGTTTMEAIWQGVPVMSWWGDRWAARTSASILREAGLSEFVTGRVSSYIRRAARWGNDPEHRQRLAELRLSMRSIVANQPVCALEDFARNMENIYRRLIEDAFMIGDDHEELEADWGHDTISDDGEIVASDDQSSASE